MLSTAMLSVATLSVVMLGVIEMGVVVPHFISTNMQPCGNIMQGVMTLSITTLSIAVLNIKDTMAKTYNDIAYNMNKCDITYIFLFTVLSKLIYN